MRSIGSRAARVILAATLAISGAAGVVLAYVQSNLVDLGFGDFGLSVPGGTLTVRLEQDASFRITNGTDLTALTDSMARWTNVTTSNAQVTDGTRFNLADPVDANAGLANDGLNRLYFAETDTLNRLGSAIAVSFFWVSGGGGITDCDIIFNERLYTFSTTTPANPNQILGSSTYDIGEIATHEMGHCLGLDHSAVAGLFSAATGEQIAGFSSGDYSQQATLFPYGSRTIQGRSLAPDDAAGVSFIYPNTTLNTTTGRITGRVLNGADFTPVRGAHVVAVATAAPNTPVVGAISDVQAGGAGGEYTLPALPPGDYYVRIEPLAAGGTNPFSQDNTHFLNFDTGFPWEFYNGTAESGFDTPGATSVVTVAAGQTVTGIDLLTNIGAPDPNEPNNTAAAATPIACEQSAAASIVPRDDVDYYRVTLGGPTLLQMDVNAGRSGSTLDAVLALFDASGIRLGFADDSIGIDPILYVELTDPGTYYVAVAAKGDEDFNGSGGVTVGSYTLQIRCTVPAVKPGTCPGRVLYAVQGAAGILAIADADGDLSFDGQTTYRAPAGFQPGTLAPRRDGAVCLGKPGGMVEAHRDNDGNFTSDLMQSLPTGLSDSLPIVGVRRGGAEHLYVGDYFGGGVVEMVDSGGDALPERTTVFTGEPGFVLSLAMDEGGTLYVLDGALNEVGGLRAYRDDDGDGVAEFSRVFLDMTPQYYGLAARRPGELFAIDIFGGRVDRLVDVDRDGVADQVTPYATGFLTGGEGIAFDADDILYIVDGGNRVLALPDDDGDGVADRQVQFSALNDGMAALAFGPGPPEEVSGPAALRPAGVAPASGGMLRLTWEDQGPTVPAYNIHEGTLGASFYAHAPILCHVAGTSDGMGGRYLDIMPAGPDSYYYLVTASDACGEGTPGRDSAGRRRPLSGGSCGAIP